MTKLDFWRRTLSSDSPMEDESTRRMVVGVLSVALAIAVLMLIANIDFGVMLVFSVLLACALVLALRGWLLPGRLLIPLAGLLMFGYLIFQTYGLRDTAILGLPMILLSASLMVGRWGAVFYGVLSLSLIIVLGVLESHGYVQNPLSQYNTLADYIAVGVSIILITALQWLVINRLNDSLRRARENEQAQIKANQQLRELQAVLEERVAELRRTEEALRANEQKYRSFVEESLEGFALADEQGKLVEWNHAQEVITGLRRKEVIGASIWDIQMRLLVPEHRSAWRVEVVRAMTQQALQTGQASFFNQLANVEICRADEQRVFVEQAAFPIKTEQGYRFGTIMRDITARKRSEEALRDSETLYQSLVEILPMSVCRKDREGRLTFVNQQYCREFHLPAANILGKTDFDLHPSDLAEKYRKDDRAVMAGGQMIELVEEHEPAGGEHSYVQVFKSPIYDAHGQVSGIQIVFWDVTERKRAEQQIHQQAARAQALAELSQLLTQVSQDYQLVLDTAVRRSAELIGDGASVFLYSPDQPWLKLASVYNPNSAAVEIFREQMEAFPIGVEEGAYGQVLKTGQPILVPVVPLERLIADSTPERRAYYQKLPLYSAMFAALRAQGKILGVVGLGRHSPGKNYTQEDLTFLQDIADRSALALLNARLYGELQQELAERKRAEHQVRQFNAELEQRVREREQLISELEAKNAELERFTYTVSHDLKSPLVTIRGFLGFLKRDAESGNFDRFKADLSRITEATDKMQQLLSDLLDLSRVGRKMNPPEEVPFEEIVREALALTAGQLSERPVQVDVARDLPLVYGDRVRLIEVVQNLIDNACKFMGDQAEPRITIGLRGTDQAGKPILFVRDNGIGIDPPYHDRVFGLFDKLDPKREGTGVGLALVKRIVELHGGRIWVESAGLGAGSTFCFTLDTHALSAK